MKSLYWVSTVLFTMAIFMNGCTEPVPTKQPTPVSEITPTEFTRDFPKNLKWLTDEEKARLIEIALNTPTALEWQQKESQYKTAINWFALNPNKEGEGYSGYQKFEYEIVAIGIPRGTIDITPEGWTTRVVSDGVPEDAEIYPDITIWFGLEWIVDVAIDMETWKIVYQEEYPNLDNPDRFKQMKHDN